LQISADVRNPATKISTLAKFFVEPGKPGPVRA
jgi:hypothetical protein